MDKCECEMGIPLPLFREIGQGKHRYLRMCRHTGSITVYRFATKAEAEAAMAKGINWDAKFRV